MQRYSNPNLPCYSERRATFQPRRNELLQWGTSPEGLHWERKFGQGPEWFEGVPGCH